MLARHGRRLLNLLDDAPVVPGDNRLPFQHGHQARQILNDAEEDLREWAPDLEPVPSAASAIGVNLMPTTAPTEDGTNRQEDFSSHSPVESRNTGGENSQLEPAERREVSGSSTVAQPELSTGYQQ